MSDTRPVIKEDIPSLKKVLDSIDLFPSNMLDEMIFDYFSNAESDDIWFTTTIKDRPVTLGYCGPEKFTDGTYNLYALGVLPEYHGLGIGKKMVQYLEDKLKLSGHRILIIDTSSTKDYLPARQFYEKLKYKKESVIRDYWAKGDDKVTYWKQLN